MRNKSPRHLKNSEKEKKQIVPEEEQKIRKKYKIDLLICLIYAIIIEAYFVGLNITKAFDIYVKISYMVLILISVVMFEISYKKQNKKILISGIEVLCLAIHTLLLERTITLFKVNNNSYILITSIIWPVYYVLKAVIIQTKETRRKLKQLSDISEIVKEEKPIKKVAKKRKK